MTDNSYKPINIPSYVRDLEESLPDEITNAVATNPQNDAPYRLEVANHLLTGGRPYYSSARIASDLDGPLQKETVQKRLDYLCDCGVAKSESVGGSLIYWYDSKDSRWPVPPDVEVRGKSVLAVREFAEKEYPRTTHLGITAVCIGSLATWGGGALLATNIFPAVSFGMIAFGLLCLPIGLSIFTVGFLRHYREHQSIFGSGRS